MTDLIKMMGYRSPWLIVGNHKFTYYIFQN